MEAVKLPLTAEKDFLENHNITKAEPISALSELIWNALDADANEVNIELIKNNLAEGISQIIISDNGAGFSYEKAKDYFTKLGGSWKKYKRVTEKENRTMHGQEGKGRLKAFSLGNFVEWDVCYKEDETFYSFKISGKSSDIGHINISSKEPLFQKQQTGVKITIDNTNKNISLDSDENLQNLTEIFALYLINYKNVKITIDKYLIDPGRAISDQKIIEINPIKDEEKHFDAHINLIIWKSNNKKSLYLCSKDGYPLIQRDTRFAISGSYSFTAYLSSEFISKLHNNSTLSLSEMNSPLDKAVSETRQKIHEFFLEKMAEEAKSTVDDWKEKEIYPYKGNPQNPVEKVERQLFDIVAVKIHEFVPQLESTQNKNAKAFHLRMLRYAIEHSPSELQKIFKQVLELTKKQQEELAELLEETSLSGIITAAKTVADRLNFIEFLSHIVFDTESKKHLKERSQLHKIIEQNTWIFGEEYNLWASDKGLKHVLQKHKKFLDPDIIIDDPIDIIGKKTGIVDLMLSRQLRKHRSDDIENLIVELKAPKITAGQNEFNQIEAYAEAVENDERYHSVKGVKWHFWLIVNSYDRLLERKINTGRNPDKRIVSESDKSSIGVKTWGELIEENRARLQFFQESLQHSAAEGKAIEKLKEKYSEVLGGKEKTSIPPE